MPMQDEEALREKLRKIEALFAGATRPGEKSAAAAAADRIRDRLGRAQREEKIQETRVSIHDIWSRQLFVALCRRYGLRPFRYRRMHQQTFVVKAPKSFIDETLWPEFETLSEALLAYLAEVTARVIREEVFSDLSDVDEMPEGRQIGPR